MHHMECKHFEMAGKCWHMWFVCFNFFPDQLSSSSQHLSSLPLEDCAMATDGVAWTKKCLPAPSLLSPPVAFFFLSEQILMHRTTSCQGEDRHNSVAYLSKFSHRNLFTCIVSRSAMAPHVRSLKNSWMMDHCNQPSYLTLYNVHSHPYSCQRETKYVTADTFENPFSEEILITKGFDQSIFADVITRKRSRSCLGFERWSKNRPRISFQHTSTICCRSWARTFWEFAKHLFSMFSLLQTTVHCLAARHRYNC